MRREASERGMNKFRVTQEPVKENIMEHYYVRYAKNLSKREPES